MGEKQNKTKLCYLSWYGGQTHGGQTRGNGPKEAIKAYLESGQHPKDKGRER